MNDSAWAPSFISAVKRTIRPSVRAYLPFLDCRANLLQAQRGVPVRAQQPCKRLQDGRYLSGEVVVGADTDEDIREIGIGFVDLFGIVVSVPAVEHGLEPDAVLCQPKSSLAAPRGCEVGLDFHRRVLFRLQRLFADINRFALHAEILVLDFAAGRIRLRFPPVGLRIEQESNRMIRIALLKAACRLARFDKIEVVRRLGRMADGLVCGWIFIDERLGECRCSKHQGQEHFDHEAIIARLKDCKKNPAASMLRGGGEV